MRGQGMMFLMVQILATSEYLQSELTVLFNWDKRPNTFLFSSGPRLLIVTGLTVVSSLGSDLSPSSIPESSTAGYTRKTLSSVVASGDVVDKSPEVVLPNCLTDTVEEMEEMEVTTEVDVETVTVWDSETKDLEAVILKLKFFFFLLILNSSDSVVVLLIDDLSVEVVVVVVVVVVVDVLSELYLMDSSQEKSLPLLLL